jgi:hypothetical protein
VSTEWRIICIHPPSRGPAAPAHHVECRRVGQTINGKRNDVNDVDDLDERVERCRVRAGPLAADVPIHEIEESDWQYAIHFCSLSNRLTSRAVL